jgi:hypothetical protein
MANTDLVLRFKAENADLKRAFRESTKEIQSLNSKISVLDRDFKKASASTAKSVESIKSELLNSVPAVSSFVGGFAKMGLAAGAVKIAADGIKSLASEALNAGQGMDGFNNMMQAAKDTYSVLASSLLAGDFSIFGDGVFKANLELAAFRDTLGDIGRSYNYVSGIANAALAEAQAVITNKNSTPEQIQNAISSVKKEIADLERISANKNEVAAGILKSFAIGQGHSNMQNADYDNIFRNFAKYDQIASDKKAYDEAVAHNKLIDKFGNLGSSVTGGTNSKTQKKVIPKLNYSKEELEIAAFVADMNDDERKELMRMYTEINANAREVSTIKRALERIINRGNNLNIATATFEKGSMADLDDQIAKIDKRLKNENLSLEAVAKLELQKESLEKTKEELESARKSFTEKMKIPVTLEDLKIPVAHVSPSDTADLDKNLNFVFDNNFSVGNAPADKDKISGINNQISAYQTLAESISKVAGATDSAESKLAQYASSLAELLGLIVPLITAIQSLAAANTAETTAATAAAAANTAQATTATVAATANVAGAGASAIAAAGNTAEATTSTVAAAANTVKAGSKLGLPGVILGIAAAAALVAFILSIKNRFAEGGIVPGSSFSGDKVLARLNSGEMVLNQSQQSRLFDMINLGARESAGATAVTGEFRLRGTDLIGVINNTKRKRSV